MPVVKRIVDVKEEDLVLHKPAADGTGRFSKARGPLLQTMALTYVYENNEVQVLCDDAHANQVHMCDDRLCAIISESSSEWFGQSICHDFVEKMFRPSLQGSRHPRLNLRADKMKAFDQDTNPVDSLGSAGTAIFILRLDGVHFEERSCEARWSVMQAKACVPPPPPENGPLFL